MWSNFIKNPFCYLSITISNFKSPIRQIISMNMHVKIPRFSPFLDPSFGHSYVSYLSFKVVGVAEELSSSGPAAEVDKFKGLVPLSVASASVAAKGVGEDASTASESARTSKSVEVEEELSFANGTSPVSLALAFNPEAPAKRAGGATTSASMVSVLESMFLPKIVFKFLFLKQMEGVDAQDNTTQQFQGIKLTAATAVRSFS